MASSQPRDQTQVGRIAGGPEPQGSPTVELLANKRGGRSQIAGGVGRGPLTTPVSFCSEETHNLERRKAALGVGAEAQ